MNGLSERQERDYRAAAAIRERAEDLNTYLASWQDAGNERRRQALTDAVGALNAVLRAAYQLRESLVSQAREFDDQAMRNAAELLERIRKERES